MDSEQIKAMYEAEFGKLPELQCLECPKHKEQAEINLRQAQANLKTIQDQASVIKGLKLAIEHMMYGLNKGGY